MFSGEANRATTRIPGYTGYKANCAEEEVPVIHCNTAKIPGKILLLYSFLKNLQDILGMFLELNLKTCMERLMV
jgi:hypothetical protein